jgi:hypothetical protein
MALRWLVRSSHGSCACFLKIHGKPTLKTSIRPIDTSFSLSPSQLIFCLFFSSHLYFVYSFVFALHASLPLLLLIELKCIEQLDSRSTDVILLLLLLLLFAQRR